jgi:hypothetical protein
LCTSTACGFQETNLPFSPRDPAPVAQQERLDDPDVGQDLLRRELLESTDQSVRILLARYNGKIKQF